MAPALTTAAPGAGVVWGWAMDLRATSTRAAGTVVRFDVKRVVVAGRQCRCRWRRKCNSHQVRHGNRNIVGDGYRPARHVGIAVRATLTSSLRCSGRAVLDTANRLWNAPFRSQVERC